jgi:hypothetical protein
MVNFKSLLKSPVISSNNSTVTINGKDYSRDCLPVLIRELQKTMNTVWVNGERTNSTTGKKSTVKCSLIYDKKKDVIGIDRGAITGYENMYVDTFMKIKKGWCACAGTTDSWDRLNISESEVKKVQDFITAIKG